MINVHIPYPVSYYYLQKDAGLTSSLDLTVGEPSLERLGHAGIQITLDIYSHVAPGLQEAAAKRFDDVLTAKYNKREKEAMGKSVSKTLAK